MLLSDEKSNEAKMLEHAMSHLLCRGITAKDSQDLMCTHDYNP